MTYGPSCSAVRIGSSQRYVRAQLPHAEGLRAVRGVYESQVEASLGIRVTETDVDAESFKLKSVL
jgi:hypothetical protein